MSNINNTAIGTDGVKPVYNPSDVWKIWNMSEIYVGEEGHTKYVPKINDMVLQWTNDGYTTYRVVGLDSETLIPELQEVNRSGMVSSLSEKDILVGVGPLAPSQTSRVYIDKSVTPHTLLVDGRNRIYGTMCSYAKIFKGALLSDKGEVISKVYNSSGKLVSENVPLELVALDNHTNYSTKIVSQCHTTHDLVDGELVTVVIYDDGGHVVSKAPLQVEVTTNIRDMASSRKYVTHISCTCPFMSKTIDTLIEYPINIPMNSLNLMGQVHYSDGSVKEMAVDGTKFEMMGLDQFVSTIIGQRIDLGLRYALSKDELGMNGDVPAGRYITAPYQLVTVNPNNSYTVKLFCYPFWIDKIQGYKMKWWLLNLDRNIFFDVTDLVKWSPTTGTYDPKAYGYMQRKTVSIDLKQVSAAYNNFVHVQIVDIMLNNTPDNSVEPWAISNESIAERPSYGKGVVGRWIDRKTFNLSSGFKSQEEWLENIYRRTYPLIDKMREIEAPDPTHYIITVNGTNIELPVEDWNKDVNVNFNIENYTTVSIRFIKRTSTGDLNLAIAAMILKNN